MESGNLAQKAVLPLLAELHQQRATGSLKLERAPLQKAVYFRDGQILFAASNDPKDQLASILVEEGKLGTDQMQVAQSRVSPGNPLAKVLTELGYISQRELAEAARLKVEKILTDIFSWKEGTYTFAEKSLPKGAIDLELSTPRLLFNSIRRMPDRDWVLAELGSLDAVLSPTAILDTFLSESDPEDQARDVLRLVDGVKTIKQIGAVSNLGEFEVCKILAGAMLLGALQKDSAESVPEAETFSTPSGGEEVLFVSDDEAAPEMPEVSGPPEPTILDRAEASLEPGERTEGAPPSFMDEAPVRTGHATGGDATHLLIDEPEPAPVSEVPLGRVPPRPRGRSRGGGGGYSKKILIGVAALVVLAAGGYAGYMFVWPMLMGSGESPATSTTPGPSQRPTAKGPAQEPPTGPTGTTGSTGQLLPDVKPPSGPTAPPGEPAPRTPTTTAGQTVSPPVQAPTPQPKTPPPTTTAPSTPTPSPPPKTAPRTPRPSAPPPPTGAPGSSLSRSYELLKDGNIRDAAAGYLQHLRSTAPDKFTLAVGVYCDASNVMRAFTNSGDSDQLIVLPYTYRGRSCYRVFWGLFDSPEAAERNFSTVPAAIRAPKSTPVPTSKLIQ